MNDSQDHSDLTSNMSLNGQCGDDPTHTTLYISKLFSTTSFLMVRVIDKTRRVQCKFLCLYVVVNIANEDKKLQTPANIIPLYARKI
jgi:hypothetical protein